MAEAKEKPEGIRNWIAGPDYQKCLNEYDVVFKSPGVVLEKPVQSYSSQILSQTELFFQCFRDQIIGITGTKGKSTITTLIYHLLKEAGMDTILVGNIRVFLCLIIWKKWERTQRSYVNFPVTSWNI